MKRLPNALTLARMAIAPALLWLRPPSGWFYALYACCCVTDVLDGYLARRTGTASRGGARLDSAADALVCAVLLAVFWPLIANTRGVIACVVIAALLRIAAATVAYVRFGRFGFLHTYLNKATGALLAAFPFAALKFAPWMAHFVCAAALISAAEELVIELSASAFEPDRKGLFIS